MDSLDSGKKKKDRVLAVDYGERRIGLAVSDPLRITAQGLETIIRRGRESGVADVLRIAAEYEAGRIIVGLPLTLSGERKEAAARVERFVDELKRATHVPIEFVDERLTSVAAKRALVSMGHKTGHKKELVDKVAAVFLLQMYLDGQSLRNGQ